jgi:hypothetical protein
LFRKYLIGRSFFLGDNESTRPTVVKEENTTHAGVLSQAAGPSHQAQQSRTTSPATIPEPPRKGRRKLNKAIFDVDTVAALRSKTQAGLQTIQVNDPPAPKVTVQQEVTGVVHPPVRLREVPLEIPLTERAPNVENITGEHPEAQTKGVSYWEFQCTITQLTKTEAYRTAPCLKSQSRAQATPEQKTLCYPRSVSQRL